jgi:hypothetical protein
MPGPEAADMETGTMSTISRRVLHDRAASYPEYPIEQVCTHAQEPFQLAFARTAKELLGARHDLELTPSHRGLTIAAETEIAIEAALASLRESYGAHLQVGPPTIRYHNGVTLEQPWMGFSVQCPMDRFAVVRLDLESRGADIFPPSVQMSRAVIDGRAPLTSLIGYGGKLARLTGGAGQLAMWLSHYAPVEPPPGGNAA